jgi:hypothetical protein
MTADDAKLLLATVIATTNADPDAAFSADAIRAAALLEAEDFSAFARYRRNLKERHVSSTLFDRALDDFKRKGRAEARVTASVPSSPSLSVPEIEPWPQAVDGETLLTDLVNAFGSLLSLPPGAAVALALWVIFSHAIDIFDIAPRLAITSPTKRCGKTRLMKVLARLTRRPLLSSNLTPASVFRVIDATRPTLLIDEADTFATLRPELRGILNSGHEHAGAFVIRTIDGEPRSFSTFAATAVAAIGKLPDTWADRSIAIELRRKKRGEKVGSPNSQSAHLDRKSVV